MPQLLSVFTENRSLLNVTYNLYTLIEFVLVYLLLERFISQRKYLFKLTGFLYVSITIWFILNYGIVNDFLNDLVCVNNILYIVMILYILIEQLENEDDKEFLLQFKKHFFWYILAIFLYSASTLMVFSMWNYVKTHNSAYIQNIWIIHHVFNFLMYALFAGGFIVDSKLDMEKLKFYNPIFYSKKH
ncbi:hypothetical protein ADIARSV_3742 [Arcticibacter svalbardensis MN12-7]|uniref:Uncharacterized protein n=1 Tax=Arcticibacter svalbardensis MN12-7 TaxID=1150600 RepID=R9GMP5_9SPHI|nr:hypothetical protein ADIARSV_3742 [Arcticibacter svalbardensis MN12-7]